MSLHLERELGHLRKWILELGAVVEECLQLAVESLERRDAAMATSVVERDSDIDHKEILIEEECMKILALHQPVATDLRFIITVLKMNNDLERIGDMAGSIAEKSLSLMKQERFTSPVDFSLMAKITRKMLREAFDALIYLDNRRACRVRETDDQVDALKAKNKAIVLSALRARPEEAEALIAVLNISRDLERIADLATNISEDVSYLLEGEIVRHGHGSKPNK